MGAEETFREAAERVLAPEVMNDLAAASVVAAKSSARVLLVGGMVRDVLIGRPSRDIDLVTVGEGAAWGKAPDLAPGLAADLASALHGSVGSQSKLLTWRIELPEGRRLDLATARTETYSAPAALPSVAPGDLDADLGRRDFTINAMAVAIGEHWGEVLDPHLGRADLDGGLLRVLHAGSFRDDPTRVLRGIELAVRHSFELESRTAELARQALAAGVLDGLSSARWRVAWRRTWIPVLESGAHALARGLRLAKRIGLLAALHPGLRLDEAGAERSGCLAEQAGEDRFRAARPARLLARALAWDEPAVAGALAARWGLSPDVAGEWESFGERLRAARRDLVEGERTPLSRLDAVVAGFTAEELCLLELSPALEGSIVRYRELVVPFRLAIGGDDLRVRGYSPGPRFGTALDRTRQARLDGLIGQDEELEYACRQLEAMER